jgi:hypothetical protein
MLPRPKVPAFLKIMSGNALAGIILSIIPGLAHLVSHRFREVRWWVLGWFLTLLAGLFFYGSAPGFLLIGLAIGLHGWIAFSHTLLAEETEFNKRVAGYAMLIIALGLIYWGIQAVALRDFVFGYSNLAIPYQNVQTGDMLLARRSRAYGGDLSRGSLVIGNFHRLYGNQVMADEYQMVGQIVALPGEEIGIVEGKFTVNDQTLDTEKFPVPRWLIGHSLSATIPADSYFVSTDYMVHAHGMNLSADMIYNTCVLKRDDIEAHAVMRWLPVSRRGFLRADE